MVFSFALVLLSVALLRIVLSTCSYKSPKRLCQNPIFITKARNIVFSLPWLRPLCELRDNFEVLTRSLKALLLSEQVFGIWNLSEKRERLALSQCFAKIISRKAIYQPSDAFEKNP